ncbi:hypothetical protein MKW94_013273, partial [Papaver nudicaule]|nr:hypothetical protein [Papaver nudicaule]
MFLSQCLKKFPSKLKSSKAQDLALQILSLMKWKANELRSAIVQYLHVRDITK